MVLYIYLALRLGRRYQLIRGKKSNFFSFSTEIYMPSKTTMSPKSNNNIHLHHKPTHSPKKSKVKPKKEEATTTSTTTVEPRMFQTINPSINRPPFWVIEEESSGGSSKKNFLCLPLINLCSLAAAFWLPCYLHTTHRHFIIV